MPSAATANILEARGLTKRFGDLVAVDNVDVALRQGEILCLFGENGAGKSTLASCLNGFLHPDAGEIVHKGRTVAFASARDAIDARIGMVHQHFVLVPEFTVLENVVVGAQPKGVLVRSRQAATRLDELCRSYGIDLDPHARVGDLSVGQQQWVEILKVLYLGAEILILDEPTAVLGPEESRKLFAIIARMRRKNLSVILISHKLDEVMQSDRVTVLRRGAVVATLATDETSPAELTRLMVGRDLAPAADMRQVAAGEAVLEVRDLSVLGNLGTRAVDGVSFDIRRHEILGIAGVAGNGQKELFEALAGVRRAESGEIRLSGRNVTRLGAKGLAREGVGHIPEDRYLEGLVGDFSIAENLILGRQRSRQFSAGPLLLWRRVREFAAERMKRFNIAAPSGAMRAGNLSGGNAQRVILAREMHRCSRLLLANQPTRGLDVGAIEFVYGQLAEQRAQGLAILLGSSELEDLFRLADRIGVMFKGRMIGMVDARTATMAEVGLLMAGQHPSHSLQTRA